MQCEHDEGTFYKILELQEKEDARRMSVETFHTPLDTRRGVCYFINRCNKNSYNGEQVM